jgi:tetratricopeptide (TPR) repeat protein
VGAFLSLALWTGLSIVWSVGPDLSWTAFDYAGLYVAAAVALAWGGTSRLHLWIACGGYLACAAAVAVYAYLGKVLPDVVTHAHEYARLAAPIGYWNVLAVMMAMAVPVALALAGRRGVSPYLRAAAAALLAFLLVTLFFTFSRGGLAAVVVALIVYFIAARERLSSLVSLLCTAGPVALVLWHLRGLETLFAATADDALRTAQGHTLGLWTIPLVLVPFALQLAVGFGHRRLGLSRTVVRAAGVSVLALVLALCVGGPLIYMQTHGGVADWTSTQYDNFINGPSTEGGDSASRLGIVSSNGRVELYRTSFEQVEHTPWLGTGAGTFVFTNDRFRDTGLVVKHAHSQWFNALSELGIIGLALLVLFVVALVAAVVIVLVQRRRDVERGFLAAAAAASGAFLFHISGDWDWDMAAATLSFLLLAITASRYRGHRLDKEEAAPLPAPADAPPAAPHADTDGAPPAAPHADATDPAAAVPQRTDQVEDVASQAEESPRSDGPEGSAVRGAPHRLAWPAVVLWAGLLVVLLVSWLLPFLSLRADSRALAAMSRGSEDVAHAQAHRAQSLNPLAVDPLITLAAVEEGRGQPRAALAALQQAARLQPDNYYVRYRLGLLLYTALGRTAAAERQFRKALQLNPFHDLSRQQLEVLGSQ